VATPLEKAIVQAVSGELKCVSYTEVSDGDNTSRSRYEAQGRYCVFHQKSGFFEVSDHRSRTVACRWGRRHSECRSGWRTGAGVVQGAWQGNKSGPGEAGPCSHFAGIDNGASAAVSFEWAKRIDRAISLFTALGPTNPRQWPRPMSRMGLTWTPMLKAVRGGRKVVPVAGKRTQEGLLQANGRRAIKSGRILRSAGY